MGARRVAGGQGAPGGAAVSDAQIEIENEIILTQLLEPACRDLFYSFKHYAAPSTPAQRHVATVAALSAYHHAQLQQARLRAAIRTRLASRARGVLHRAALTARKEMLLLDVPPPPRSCRGGLQVPTRPLSDLERNFMACDATQTA